MKSRELSANEVKIPLSVRDIAEIEGDPSPALPFNPEAFEALKSGLSIRGREMNIFLCGPSASEREKLLKHSIHHLTPGACCKTDSPPVIYENNPKAKRFPESLQEADGGLLVLAAEDLIEEKKSWKLLKRAIRNGSLSWNKNKDAPAQPGMDIKVCITGNEQHYDYFYNSDEEFKELFQFFAEIDSVIELNQNNLKNTVNCLRNFSKKSSGKALSDEGCLELIKYSISTAENKKKLSTVLSDLEIIIREAAWASGERTGAVSGDDIRKTISRQGARFSLLEKRIIEEMKSGEIDLHLEGSEVGKVNGLAVIDKGPWAFGSPGLISATIAPGENGLINIEHEAGLSGEIHDKWVLILEAFLRSRFAHDFPISIFASICFEQSYSEIDGDSASSSELYALLSAISGVPIRQDIAVTGSLSQTGGILAVGGLREKIEGFYRTCRAINFTGTQGVIIPERNINSIILPEDIIEEISRGNFHIYPVSTVDNSMEILTGREAGKRNARGQFPPGTLNHMIEKNLKKIAGQVKNFS